MYKSDPDVSIKSDSESDTEDFSTDEILDSNPVSESFVLCFCKTFNDDANSLEKTTLLRPAVTVENAIVHRSILSVISC